MTKKIEEGAERETKRGKEIWDGEQWLTAIEAVEQLGIGFEEVGKLVSEKRMGGGAMGSAGEYSMYWRIWQVGDKWVLDMGDEGLDHVVCDSLEDCEAELDAQAEVYYGDDYEG